MDNSTTAAMMMTSFTTQLGQSNLWFSTWTPTSAGSTFGACFGLFLLAAFSRLLSAVAHAAQSAWSTRAALIRTAATLSPQLSNDTFVDPKSSPSSSPPLASQSQSHAHAHQAPPFILAVDLPRGVLFAFQSFIQYFLMLAVMSYNAYFFIAILVGLGVGEMSFGRFTGRGGGDGVHS
ncbi:hypothetical protein RQP46_005441 [Phenoliferia psychrophenolica]